MIHVITAANRHLFERELFDYHRARRPPTPAPSKPKASPSLAKNGDGDDVIYLLGIDDGRVYGGARLVPTLKRDVLGDMFPMQRIPRDPSAFEWTRVLLTDGCGERHNSRVETGAMICELLEFCLEQGVAALRGVTDAWWLPWFHDMGWTVRPLDLPERVDRDWVLAVVVPINETTLESTRRFYGLDQPLMSRKSVLRPVAREVLS
jgi:acyl-homoserine lactone synthase